MMRHIKDAAGSTMSALHARTGSALWTRSNSTIQEQRISAAEHTNSISVNRKFAAQTAVFSRCHTLVHLSHSRQLQAEDQNQTQKSRVK